MSDWNITGKRELIKALKPGGWVRGHSGCFRRYLTLHKTDIIADLQKENETSLFQWRIDGEPLATGRYAPQRRTITIWLGK